MSCVPGRTDRLSPCFYRGLDQQIGHHAVIALGYVACEAETLSKLPPDRFNLGFPAISQN
jgi:hypothetical protein